MFLARHADLVGEEGWSPMTETLKGMGSMPKDAKKIAKPGEAKRAAVRELVKAARPREDYLTHPDGLLKMIMATVLQAALDGEMTEHLRYEKPNPPSIQAGTSVTAPDPRQS